MRSSPGHRVDPPVGMIACLAFLSGCSGFEFKAGVSGASQALSSSSPKLNTFAPPTPATTQILASVSQYGITWQFSQPRPVGQFINGDYWVVGPVSITSITPGTTSVGGDSLHGSMLDPQITDKPIPGGGGTQYGHGYLSISPIGDRYSPNLNIAIGVSQTTPLVISPVSGAARSLVSSISWNTTPLPAVSWSRIRTAAVLTVVHPDSLPPADAFRIPYAASPSGTKAATYFREAHIDWAMFPSVPVPVGVTPPSLSALTPRFQRVWLDHMAGWPSRYMHPVENMPDYGRDFTTLFNEGAMSLALNYTQAQKRMLAIYLLQIGIDFWGNVSAGAWWEGVGGQGSGRKLPILLAGRAFVGAPGADAMYAIGTTHPSYLMTAPSNPNQTQIIAPGQPGHRSHFGEDCQTFYVQATGSNFNYGHGGYSGEHVGMPEWGNGHTHTPHLDSVIWHTIDGGGDSYRNCCTANAWVGGVLFVRMVPGMREAWNHPALFDYQDRYMSTEEALSTEEAPSWTRSWATWLEGMWDTYRVSY